MRIIGKYLVLGDTHYFIPDPLPPRNPGLVLTSEILTLYGDIMLELGKLNEMTKRLPNKERFIKAYVIKEALLSSSIEGIHTTLLDVFTQPLLETRITKETQLVTNYVDALSAAIVLIRDKGLPLSNRVILKAHEELFHTGESDAGGYRKQSVRVGQLIPPPPSHIPDLMASLEHYIHEQDVNIPTLIQAGLVHVQFEEIHPFLDGNGRIGRLLIVLMLIEREILQEPILYPSYYFKKRQLEYYQCLDKVRTEGDFEGWITFYLTVMKDSCIDAYRRAKDIEHLEQDLIEYIMHQKQLTQKMQEVRVQALSILFNYPVITVGKLADQMDIAYNTAHTILHDFIDFKIVVAETQQKRGRLFKFKPYLDVLERECD